MKAMILILMCAMAAAACAVDVDSTGAVQQDLCTVEQCDWDGSNCITILTTCGTGGGGGNPTGGGGGSCPIVDINGNCVHPNVGSCLTQQACDPTLTPFGGVDVSCVGACGSTQAICAAVYRCGRDPSCPEAHYGYCYVP